MSSLEDLVRSISEQTGLSRKEIHEKIVQKKEELTNLVTDVGAAHIVARDLNVTLAKPSEARSKGATIKEILSMEPGIASVSVTGIIRRIYSPFSFKKKDREGTVQNLLVMDNTGTIRVVIWGSQTRISSEEFLASGELIRIIRASLRKGRSGEVEVHVGNQSQIQIQPPGVDPSDFPEFSTFLTPLEQTELGEDEIDVEGIVVNVGKLSIFPRKDGSQGKVASLLVSDGEVSQRAVFWDQQAESAIGFSEGDKILMEGIRVREDRDGTPELHLGSRSRVSKIGREAVPQDAKMLLGGEKPVKKKIIDLQLGDRSITIEDLRFGGHGRTSVFTRDGGSQGSVSRCVVYDDTGGATLVLWDDDIDRIQNLQQGDGLFIQGAFLKKAFRGEAFEIHLGRMGQIQTKESVDIPMDPNFTPLNELDTASGIVSLRGLVGEISEVREFSRESDGSTGKVSWMTLGDQAGTARIVAWGDDIDALEACKDAPAAEIYLGMVRKREGKVEVHLAEFSDVKPISEESLPDTLVGLEPPEPTPSFTERDYEQTTLMDLDNKEFIEVRGILASVSPFSPYYMACRECSKKVEENENSNLICREHGIVDPIPRLRISTVIDDGTENTRAVFMGSSAEKILKKTGEEIKEIAERNEDEAIDVVKNGVQGLDVVIRGKFRYREIPDREPQPEIVVNTVKFPIALDEAKRLLKDLEVSIL